MIERTLQHWRELPDLRVKECAALAGVSERQMEDFLKDPALSVRHRGRIRFVTTDSFRRWLGEEVTPPEEDSAPTRKTKRAADNLMRRVG